MEFNVYSWLPGGTTTRSEIVIISKTSRNHCRWAERRACMKGSGSPIYLLTWTPSGRPQIATSLVKMTMTFALVKKSGCPIYPSHHLWECKLHEKDSSHGFPEASPARCRGPPKGALASLFKVNTLEVRLSSASCHRVLGKQGKSLSLGTGRLLRSGLSCVCPNLPPW